MLLSGTQKWLLYVWCTLHPWRTRHKSLLRAQGKREFMRYTVKSGTEVNDPLGALFLSAPFFALLSLVPPWGVNATCQQYGFRTKVSQCLTYLKLHYPSSSFHFISFTQPCKKTQSIQYIFSKYHFTTSSPSQF